MFVCRVLCHSLARCGLVLTLVAALSLSGCMSPEQRMILKVEGLMEQQKFDGALSYLERYLGRYGKSLAAWRFRVLIRLEQEQRATAAAEYAALNTALGRHEPDVLREVVLGAGGRWLLSDYALLARCGSARLTDAGFFKELLSAQHLGRGSMSKVAVSDDEIAAVLDALPGALSAAETWPLLEAQSETTSPPIRARLVAAAARHLKAGGLDERAQGASLDWINAAAADGDPRLREAALRAAILLPPGPGRGSILAHIVDAFRTARDGQRTASMLLSGANPETGWTTVQLERWAATDSEPLSTLALAALQHRIPTRTRERALKADAQSGATARILAAATGPDGSPEIVWPNLHVEDRRAWAAAMVRSGAADRGRWAAVILSDSDAPVVQAAANGLALMQAEPGEDKALTAPLRVALGSRDASSRAAAARAIIVRTMTGLLPEIEALAEAGDERVMLSALDALIETGATGWGSLVKAGLGADIALVRERAVDAAAASCDEAQHELLSALLTDADPHVAVRAAAVLYLGVGLKTR